jgi:hypothetical protein
MGKFQRIKKIKRELKELKVCFPNNSLKSIKEEVVPVVLAKITDFLTNEGQDGLEDCLGLLNHYHITNEKFKENIIDLQSKESIIKRFEKLAPAIKASLTRKLNERNKTSVAHKRKKEKGSAIGDTGNVKYDEEGNIRDVFADNEEDEEEDEVSIKTKKTTKGKKTTKAKKTK